MTGEVISRLADLPNLASEPGAVMRRFGGRQAMLQEAHLPKGSRFEPHSHHNEQIVLVLEGRIRLDIGEPAGRQRSVEMGPGDLLLLPPHLPHGGEALEDCRLLDLFSPPRTTVLGEPEPGPESGPETGSEMASETGA